MMESLATIPQPTLLALAAVIIIGLPHGALDGAIAIYLGYSKRVVLLLRFVLLYVVAAALVVAAWMAAPAICLLIFLVISMLHFGLGDARPGGGWEGFLEAVAHGGLVVAGISLIHRDEVDVIFGYLVGGSTQMVWQGLEIMAVIIAIALAFCVIKGVTDRRWRAGFAELLLLAVLFVFTPPLVGFAVYFCLVHTVRHVRTVLSGLAAGMSGRMVFTQAALFTIASWLAGAVAFWLLASPGSAESALLRVVFIGLAALTVPHMILVDGLLRNARPSLKRRFISR